MPTDGYIWTMNVHICDTYEVTGTNHVTTSTVHILHKLHFMLFPYITQHIAMHCHTTNIGHTVFILYWHIDPTVAHMCKKTINCIPSHVTSGDLDIKLIFVHPDQKPAI